METIREDIHKSQFRSCYLLCGEEAYLREDYVGRLLKALLEGEESLNLTKYIDRDVSAEDVIDMADTPPFFAPRRVLLLRNPNMNKEAKDKVAEYLKNPPDYLVVLFDIETADKRTKLYKTIAKVGHVATFDRMKTPELVNWVAQYLARENKAITRRDAQGFVERVGDDMALLSNEMKKLVAYTGNRSSVTRADIEAVCTESLQDRMFVMFTAISNHDQEKALELYYDLVALRVPVIKMLVLLGRQYSQLLRAKDAKAQGYGYTEMASRIGVRDFVVKNLLQTVSSYSKQELEACLQEIVETDEAIKTGRMEERLAFETLIIHLSARA